MARSFWIGSFLLVEGPARATRAECGRDYATWEPEVDRGLFERARAPDSPEMRLVWALLENALATLACRSRRGRDAREEAEAWVRGGAVSRWCFSFEQVCDLLGLDEKAARGRILATAAHGVGPPRRTLDLRSGRRWRR